MRNEDYQSGIQKELPPLYETISIAKDLDELASIIAFNYPDDEDIVYKENETGPKNSLLKIIENVQAGHKQGSYGYIMNLLIEFKNLNPEVIEKIQRLWEVENFVHEGIEISNKESLLRALYKRQEREHGSEQANKVVGFMQVRTNEDIPSHIMNPDEIAIMTALIHSNRWH